MQKLRTVSQPNSEWGKIEQGLKEIPMSRNSFDKLAVAAGAKMKYGRSVYYNLPKMKKYLEENCTIR